MIARRAISTRGFTLYEALAALVLAGIVLPVAMQAVSISTVAAGHAADRATAIMLCESKLSELLATGDWRDGGLAGDFASDAFDLPEISAATEPDAVRFEWQATVNDWRDSQLKEITVTVTWTRRGQAHSVSLTTLAPSEEALPS
jgi:type II secretory pathway pseudopilin PulG